MSRTLVGWSGFAAFGGAACVGAAAQTSAPRPPVLVPAPVRLAAEERATAAGADPRVTALVTSACAKLADANGSVLAATSSAVSSFLPPLASTCVLTGRGAWAFRLAAGSSAGDPVHASLHLWLAHLDATGKLDDEIDAPTLESGRGKEDNCCDSWVTTQVTVTPLVDYDHDGEIELYVGAVQSGGEGEHLESHTIFTVLGAAIVPLPAAAKMPLVGVEDVDKDGLPDLLLRYFEGKDEGPCTGFSYTTSGPSLLGHARRDGTFSVDDDTARAFARKLCPAAPSGDPLTRDVACAVLWGAPRELVTAYDRELTTCRAANPGPFDACQNRPDPCDARRVERAFASTTPPLVLP